MAPEQFAGQPASVRSDIYALGLILFELFTGKRAVDSKSLAEVQAFHQSGAIATPSTFVLDLDPAVERVILRCLEKDPERRPASALVVAASLPGSDPLAAALAAGETPSPDLIAAAAETGAVAARAAVSMLVLTIAGLLAFAVMSSRSSLTARVPLALAPAVLEDRAEQILAALGYPRGGEDHASGFLRRSNYIQWLFLTRTSPTRYEPVAAGRPSLIQFWYRTSPRPLLPIGQRTVSLSDPPVTAPDMRTVVLDSRGRLQEFQSVPPGTDGQTPSAVVTPPWERLFDAAALPMSTFVPVAPEMIPPNFADARAAWEGPLPGDDAVRIRVEASGYRGRPVSFAIAGPWTRIESITPRQQSAIDRAITVAVTVVAALLLAIGGWLARRSLRKGRADRRGAARLAAFTVATGALAWMCGAHHTPDVAAEFEGMMDAAADVAFGGVAAWLLYVGLEPYIRKLWPDTLLGWSRIVAGHLRDPRVGWNVQVGVVLGIMLALIDVARATIIPAAGYDAPSPTYGNAVEMLAGGTDVLYRWFRAALASTQIALLLVLLIVLVRLALRRSWLTVPVTVLILGASAAAQLGTTNAPFVFVFPIASGLLLAWVLTRSGLLTFAITWFVWRVLTDVPVMPDVSHWSAAAGNWTILLVLGFGLFGLYAARAGQPLFGAILKD
jgi:hypothetical protein